MTNFKLISDSTSDLEEELIKELDIEILPLYVSFEDDDNPLRDGIDIKQQDIADHVKKTGCLPRTSAIPPLIFEECFNKYIDMGLHVFYTGIGSKFSSCYTNAMLAKNNCKNPDMVTVIDSFNLSSGTGLIILKMRDYLKQGLNPEEVKEKIENEIVPNVSTSFCLNTIDYMAKGGRCKAATAFLTKILMIKPILVVKNGELVLGKKPIGNINIAIRTIYMDLMKEIDECDMDYVYVTEFLSESASNFITPLIRKNTKFKNIYLSKAGSVIGSHCGPGCIGILYIRKPKDIKE